MFVGEFPFVGRQWQKFFQGILIWRLEVLNLTVSRGNARIEIGIWKECGELDLRGLIAAMCVGNWHFSE